MLYLYHEKSPSKSKDEIAIGDLIIERKSNFRNKRLGEVIFIREGRRKKFEMIELNRHNLTPISRNNLEGPKTFSLFQKDFKKLNRLKFVKKKTFQIGDTIKFTKRGISKYGIITSFVHPDGLYSDSYEKGYNGKDFLECIQILPRKGLKAQVRLQWQGIHFLRHS